MQDFGQTLDETTVKNGLRRLNPDFHFDLGTNIGQHHPYQQTRQGVYFRGSHICSMDRGMIPEYKVWSVVESLVPGTMGDADRDDAKVKYVVLHPSTPGYADMWHAAMDGKLDGHFVRQDGALIQFQVWIKQKTRGKCISVGWRHTFERILRHQIPGVTREALARQFNIDMMKIPVGSTPQDAVAILLEE